MRKSIQSTGALVLALIVTLPIYGQETVDLKIEFPKDGQTHVQCDLTHSGSLVVKPEGKDEVQVLPMSVDARLNFFQLVNGKDQAIRFYESAAANIKIEKGKTAPKLTESNQLVVARLKSGEDDLVELASISDTLIQSELELLQNPADPLTLPALFEKSKAKVGERWTPSLPALAKMLRVHTITKSKVECLLKKHDDDLARVYIMGSIEADVDDVATDIELSGIAIINTDSNTLESFKLSLRQTRDPGQIAPGFDGKIKIDLRCDSATTARLSRKSLAAATKGRKIRQRVKWEFPARFVVNYEPRWKMITAEQDAAVLRYIDKNDLLAQCNIVQLPSRPASKPLTLDSYKKEVAKIVQGDKNARLVSATDIPAGNGNRAMRVIVSGDEEGLPVNWFYYHVGGKDGRQVTFVFTLAESVAGRVDPIANRLVSEFKFQPLQKKVATKRLPSSKSSTSRSR